MTKSQNSRDSNLTKYFHGPRIESLYFLAWVFRGGVKGGCNVKMRRQPTFVYLISVYRIKWLNTKFTTENNYMYIIAHKDHKAQFHLRTNSEFTINI